MTWLTSVHRYHIYTTVRAGIIGIPLNLSYNKRLLLVQVGLFDPLAGASGGKKAPPPRPAPPKTAASAASNDSWAAFGGGPAGTSNDLFGGGSSSASPWG